MPKTKVCKCGHSIKKHPEMWEHLRMKFLTYCINPKCSGSGDTPCKLYREKK